MADQKVLETQQWLNETYTLGLTEDGQTGYNTVRGLIKALQAELEITADGSFGVGTKNSFNSMFPNGISKDTEANSQKIRNIIRIINGGYWCRGIEAEYNDQFAFTIATENATKILKGQLGVDDSNGVVSGIELKAILTTDAYTLQGDEKIREIQQALNQKYINILGFYIATNGIYERNTNTAIIKAIQSEIGVDVDGGWGNQTKNALPVLGPGSSRKNLVYLLQYLLYLNGFDPNGFDGGYGNGVTNAVKQFQTLYVLDADGYCGKQTWSALVVSCGDTSRSANACDTRFEITDTLAQTLKNNGFEVIGRYINGGSFKELREGELERIFAAGLKIFFIYQESNNSLEDFSYSKGYNAGIAASERARAHKLPVNSIIYFAVDLDVYAENIDTNIVPYFKGIKDSIDNNFKIGVYGPRKVCSELAQNNLTTSSFVSDMSYGYSCNIGNPIPSDWCYDQFYEISNYVEGFDLDKVIYRGNIPATENLNSDEYTFVNENNNNVISFLETIYNCANDFINSSLNTTRPTPLTNNTITKNALVLQFLREPIYSGVAWASVVEGLDSIWISYAKERITTNPLEQYIYINNTTKIGLIHFAIVMESNLINRYVRNESNFTDPFVDLAGWAGDLLQFASTLDEKIAIEDRNSFTVDKLIEEIGNMSTVYGFDLEDLIQDIDAVNIYHKLLTKSINDAFEEYYKSNEQKLRFNQFYIELSNRNDLPNGITQTSSVYELLYAFAYQYLAKTTDDIATCISSTAFSTILYNNYDIDDWADKVANAFATKIAELVNLEI